MTWAQMLVLNVIWSGSGVALGWFLRACKAEREEDARWWAEHNEWMALHYPAHSPREGAE